MKNDFYVYLHKTLEGRPFYVGKGRLKRAYVRSNRSKAWKIAAEGGYDVEILKTNLSEHEALEVEADLIKSMCGLVNRTPATKVKFDDFLNYFKVDPNSPSGLSRINGTFNGLYFKGKIGPCGYKSRTNSGNYFWRVKYRNKSVVVHRIVWELTFGKIPEGFVIDHIDGNSLNNNADNLRLVTQELNCRNRAISKNNTSGVNGITKDSQGFRVFWYDKSGHKRSKRFGFNRCGNEEIAFKQAVEFRNTVTSDLGYTDRHGT